VIEGIPEIPERVSRRLLRYQNTRSASLAGWHPSGEGILISTRFAETRQIHWVKAAAGARHQLTFFDEPIGEISVSPNGQKPGLVFGRDVGGSEFFQLFHLDLESGAHRLLTDGKSRNSSASISNRGDRMAYLTTRRNGKDWDIHLLDLAPGGVSKPILEKGGAWFPGPWSPDDRHLLVVRYVSANESYPYRLDLQSGELTELAPSDQKISYGSAIWSRDGKGVYYSSDEGSHFRKLQYLDLVEGTKETLSGGIDWDVGQVELSEDGRWLAFNVNAGGVSQLHLWETATRRPISMPDIPQGQIRGFSFSPDSNRLGMNLVTPQTPGDVYVLNLESRKLDRWTHSEVGGLDTGSFSMPEEIHFPTFDTVAGAPREIPAFYYQPPKQPAAPYPVVINIHGGPEAQHRPGFSASTQYMLHELGIAVLAPNVRGSSGYGKQYLRLDNGFLREDSVKDIGALLDWIKGRPELDASRVVVMGGSYGGYMVLASMTHYNERLLGGVDAVGISNFVTFLENTQDYRRDLRRVEYGDERDAEMRRFLERISPANSAGKITKPLFIAQGLNDPRVPASEAEQILAAVRQNGSDPWYLLAKDEGHGFRKKSNRDFFESSVILFLEYLLQADAPTPEGSAAGGE
jgi:dipeptidyl aminopeptidase/acylaminoacyl peptidase